MSQPAPTPFVEAFAAPPPSSGIGWLDEARRENHAAFLAAGLPDTRTEAWKYTALRALGQRRFVPGDAQALERPLDPALLAVPGAAGPTLVFVNGAFRADLSALDALPAGVSLEPLSAVLARDPEPLRFAMARHWRERGDAFARLNAAFAGDGVALRVAAGTRVSAPLRLLFLGAPADAELAWHLRHVVIVEQGATASLVEQHRGGAGQGAQLATHVTDVQLQADARLDHLVLQEAETTATLVRRTGYRLDARASARVHAVELGGALARHDLHAELAGEGAAFQSHGAFLPHGRQHMDTQLAIVHAVGRTTSSCVWRGIADGRGRGVFRGAIAVAPGADGSDASLNNKNLLLSPQAEIDTKPELEIYADEVKAAHGATIGQLDARSLFYLRSRGLPREQAKALLTAAFARAPFAGLADGALREAVDERLLAQLGRE